MKAFATRMKLKGLKTIRYYPSPNNKDANQELMDVILMTPPTTYEKKKGVLGAITSQG